MEAYAAAITVVGFFLIIACIGAMSATARMETILAILTIVIVLALVVGGVCFFIDPR